MKFSAIDLLAAARIGVADYSGRATTGHSRVVSVQWGAKRPAR
jgi:hypothetical protein